MLQQQPRNGYRPGHFASRRLTEEELNYSTRSKEVFACLWVREKWRLLLLSRRFGLERDPQVLVTLFSTQRFIQDHTVTRLVLFEVIRLLRGYWTTKPSDPALASFCGLRTELSVVHEFLLRGQQLIPPAALRHELIQSAYHMH